MLQFIAGCFFGAFIMFGAQTQGKRLQELQEAIQKRQGMKRPIIIEGEDPTQRLIDDEFDAVKEE